MLVIILDKVLLSDIPGGEIANSINRNNSNVLNGSQKILGLETISKIYFY